MGALDTRNKETLSELAKKATPLESGSSLYKYDEHIDIVIIGYKINNTYLLYPTKNTAPLVLGTENESGDHRLEVTRRRQ